LAFTVTFPTAGPLLTAKDVTEWLIDQGEPFDQDGPYSISLRALPVRLILTLDGTMQGQLEITQAVPVARLVNLLFSLSVRAGADVRLAGAGRVNRPTLWMKLADEQDRMRIAEALDRSEERGNRPEVVNRLWQVLAAFQPGADVRWDANQRRVVELKEVGPDDGITEEEAKWLDENAAEGDLIPVEVAGCPHIPAWRWLSEAYPGLSDP
jgi:hypothetical protein